MSDEITLRPVDPSQRIVALDALRGLALYGVLLVNLVDEFRVSLFEFLRVFHTDPGWWNRATDDLIALFVEQKAMVVFSLLFGVGLGIQTERLRARRVSVPWFVVRRYAVLLVIGAVHLLFVWTGDILAEYALAALLIVPLLGLRPIVLAAIGVAVLLWWSSPFPPPKLAFPSHEGMAQLAAEGSRVYGGGSFAEVQEFRFEELESGIAPLLVSVFPRTVGLFLLGAALSGAGFVRAPPRRPALIAAASGLAIGGTLSALNVLAAEGIVDLGRSGGPVSNAAALLMGLGYAAAFAIAIDRPWLVRVGGWLAPVGRMALTNYLLQSLVCIALFYGIGFGLMDRIGSAAGALLATLIFAAQVWASAFWLRRHRFGPVEWIWRRLSYGRTGT
jgi:uncharacterized protein